MNFRSQSIRATAFARLATLATGIAILATGVAILATGVASAAPGGARGDPISTHEDAPSAGGLGPVAQDDVDLTPLAELAKGLVIDITKLAGPDQKLGEREAYRLLSQIDGNGGSRQVHLDFLHAVLNPDDVRKLGTMPAGTAAERVVAAQRIVQAIALGGRGGGPPFENVAVVLLPLLGRGPDDLRESVVGAVQVLIGWERKAAARAPAGAVPQGETVLDQLGSIVAGGDNEIKTAPSETVLVDASRILWESDGKLFLDRAIEGMILFKESESSTVPLYLGQLRTRLMIDFPTVDGWKDWWGRHKGKTMPQIVIESQRKISVDQAAAWRETLKRLSETSDAERLISELEAALQSEYIVEKRLVAIAALGEVSDWIRMVEFPGAAAEQEKMREAFLARACSRLIDVARGMAREHEYPEVSRAALAELGRYQKFLESGGDSLRARLVQLIDSRFERTLAMRPTSAGDARWADWQAELIELVRAAGALKVLEARVAVEGILSDSELVEEIAMTRACLQAIGRMVKPGLNLGTASLVTRVFKAAKSSTGDDALDLRADCANVLDARPEDDTVRDLLRAFHVEQLQQHDEPKLHIPAIGGLSTLAQESDELAQAALVSVLASPERFDTQALIAVVNAVAYVGGHAALEQFLPFLHARTLPQGKEKDVADHLFNKVKGIIAPQGAEGLDWLLGRLEAQGYAADDLTYLGYGLEVVQDPRFHGILLVAVNEVTATNGRLRASWSASLAHLRAVELTAGDSAATAAYGKLVELIKKEPLLKEKEPALVVELEDRLASRQLRGGILARIASEKPIELQGLLKDLAQLVEGEVASVPRQPNGGGDADSGNEGAGNGGAVKKGRGGAEPTPKADAARGDDLAAGDGAAASVEATARALRTRWAHLRWIESLLASERVRGDERLETLAGLWSTFLAAEENVKLWRGLPEGFRDRYVTRLQAMPQKSERSEE